jgi:hypothetical protein
VKTVSIVGPAGRKAVEVSRMTKRAASAIQSRMAANRAFFSAFYSASR